MKAFGEKIQLQKDVQARCRWLTLVIIATEVVEIRRMEVRSQPRQIVCKTLCQKNPVQKKKRLVEWLKV
jgi:hypothetical protein